jgi:NAD(P)-dependent dehydrogenase (short-subunit alcohol dehydrogenase family)
LIDGALFFPTIFLCLSFSSALFHGMEMEMERKTHAPLLLFIFLMSAAATMNERTNQPIRSLVLLVNRPTNLMNKVAATGRRGRVIFIGTGGGVLSPAPPLLSAYMASKWAIEAFCGCFRLEMQLKRLPIDACVLNPGFVKPTALMEIGLRMKDKMWKDCRDLNGGSNIAEDEYGEMLQTFIEYSANEKVRVCPPECVSWVKK